MFEIIIINKKFKKRVITHAYTHIYLSTSLSDFMYMEQSLNYSILPVA